jgi:hypothetical protein
MMNVLIEFIISGLWEMKCFEAAKADMAGLPERHYS